MTTLDDDDDDDDANDNDDDVPDHDDGHDSDEWLHYRLSYMMQTNSYRFVRKSSIPL